jgi:hypothetical protein
MSGDRNVQRFICMICGKPIKKAPIHFSIVIGHKECLETRGDSENADTDAEKDCSTRR